MAFAISWPWTPSTSPQPAGSEPNPAAEIAFLGTATGTLVFGSFIAWRNFRNGRGDRQAARRLAIYMFAAGLPIVFLVEHQPGHAVPDIFDVARKVGYCLFWSGAAWVVYMAVEPLARRHWPQLLVSWTRLIAGRYGDPLVGRDLLIGTFLGCASACLVHTSYSLPVVATPFIPLASVLGGHWEAMGLFFDMVMKGLVFYPLARLFSWS